MNHCSMSVHINGQVLTQVPHTKNTVFIDQNLTWQKHTEVVLQRVRGKFKSSYIVYIVYGLYLILSYDNIVALFFLFLIIVTLCGLL